MKKLISMFLSLVLFLGICPVTFAGGTDAVEILSDGTRLTYVSTERIHEARQMLVDRISKNRERKFSTAGNIAMKVASFAGGALLCCAESNVENPYVRGSLIAITALATLVTFFYPEYVSYDVNQAENHRMHVENSYKDDYYWSISVSDRKSRLKASRTLFDKIREDSPIGLFISNHPGGLFYACEGRGLTGLLDCLDCYIRCLNKTAQCKGSIISYYDEFYKSGIIIVERPNGFKKCSSYQSGIYEQNFRDIGYLHRKIESEIARKD